MRITGRMVALTAVLGMVAGGVLSGCADHEGALAPVSGGASPPPAAPPPVVPPAAPAPEGKVAFSRWLADFRAEALAKGISPATLDATLPGITLQPRVVELDHKQPEGTVTFATYVSRTLTPDRIQRGRALMKENKATLAAIQARYGVPARYIVALWGMESGFGRVMGNFRVLDSLATLAYDGRRAPMFRRELVAALRIVQEDRVDPAIMKGSWAGAMGQVQFMPTTFFKFAQDFDGCGRRDIWTRVPDVLASAANYLSTVGWRADQPWGREVRLPAAGIDSAAIGAVIGLEHKRTLAEWRRAGLRRLDGGVLPDGDTLASLVMPDGPTGRAFLVQDNYRTIMDWNRSTYFATTVGLLADQLGEGG